MVATQERTHRGYTLLIVNSFVLLCVSEALGGLKESLEWQKGAKGCIASHAFEAFFQVWLSRSDERAEWSIHRSSASYGEDCGHR